MKPSHHCSGQTCGRATASSTSVTPPSAAAKPSARESSSRVPASHANPIAAIAARISGAASSPIARLSAVASPPIAPRLKVGDATITSTSTSVSTIWSAW